MTTQFENMEQLYIAIDKKATFVAAPPLKRTRA